MRSHILRSGMEENVPMLKMMLMKTNVATVMRGIKVMRNG